MVRVSERACVSVSAGERLAGVPCQSPALPVFLASTVLHHQLVSNVVQTILRNVHAQLSLQIPASMDLLPDETTRHCKVYLYARTKRSFLYVRVEYALGNKGGISCGSQGAR
jgi:hypothetical protein